jgi:hypothetical protein
MNMRAFPLIASLVLICAQGAALRAQDSDAIRKFEAEAFRAWQEYLPHTKKMVGKWEGKHTWAGKLQSHYIVELKQNNGCCMVISTPLVAAQKMDDALLFANNSEYFFTLRKKKQARDWVLSDLGTDKKKMDQFVKSTLLDGLDHLLAVEPDVRLTDLVALPYFKVVRARFVVLENRKLVELEFDSFHELPKKDWRVKVQKGTLILDPSNLWCLKSANLETVSFNPEAPNSPNWSWRPAKTVIEYTYRSEDRVPVPESRIERASDEHGQSESRIDYGINLLDVPDTDFRLSAFGLPEPKGVTWRKPIPYYLWIMGGGFASLVIGVFLRRWLAKKTAPPGKMGQEKLMS